MYIAASEIELTVFHPQLTTFIFRFIKPRAQESVISVQSEINVTD